MRAAKRATFCYGVTMTAKPSDARQRVKRVLALVTDAYGGYGGIAAYSRDALGALSEDDSVGEIVALPRLVPQPIADVPAKLRYETGAAGGALAYIRHALSRGLLGGRFDLIYCAHINLVPLTWLVAKLTGTPWALCLHGREAWTLTRRRAVNALAGRADRYIVISQLTLDRFLAAWPVDPDRCRIVPNAIHMEQFGAGAKNPTLESRYGLAGKRVLMTLGRLDPSEQAKGFDRVIELLPRIKRRIPDIAYLICGDGRDRQRLEDLAAGAGVRDLVVFAGMIEEAEKADHYRLADLYVMPSTLEGFGFVFLEAMACGIPVIASSIDGGREAVRMGALGQMIDPFDRDALEQAIYRGLDQPRAIPPGLGYFGYENFQARLRDALGPVMRP